MATAQTDLTDWYWGEDRVFQFVVKDDNGVAVNITGWTFKWELRTLDTDAVAKLTKTTANAGCVIVDAVNGKMEVRIAKADTDPSGGTPLVTGQYRHALSRTDAGVWDVLAIGSATLSTAPVRP